MGFWRRHVPYIRLDDPEAKTFAHFFLQIGSHDHLAEITIPTLVTHGRHDFMVPTVNGISLSQDLPNATLIVYADAGHGHAFQFPELHAHHVDTFLA